MGVVVEVHCKNKRVPLPTPSPNPNKLAALRKLMPWDFIAVCVVYAFQQDFGCEHLLWIKWV